MIAAIRRSLRRRAVARHRRRCAGLRAELPPVFVVRRGELARPVLRTAVKVSLLFLRTHPAAPRLRARGHRLTRDAVAAVHAAYPAVAGALGRALPEGYRLLAAVAEPPDGDALGVCFSYRTHAGRQGGFLLVAPKAVGSSMLRNVAAHELAHAIHTGATATTGAVAAVDLAAHRVAAERVAVAVEAAVAIHPDAWNGAQAETAEAVAWLREVGPEAALAYARAAVAGAGGPG